jgi:HAD superfamily hydrolase (TIGR01662 family)
MNRTRLPGLTVSKPPLPASAALPHAVFFDVDFTLIFPGPTFRGEGYQGFCAQHGIEVDASRFELAVAAAAPLLEGSDEPAYDNELFVRYTARIIEEMGGRGDAVTVCAREIHSQWSGNHHFELYDDVPGVLRELVTTGIRVGLISNSHRCLESFQTHFELQGLISAAVTSAEHGYMKPHPSIFRAALEQAQITPADAVMVGDSVRHDVEGALRVGMRAVLLHRGTEPHKHSSALAAIGVSTIASLRELPRILRLREGS